MTHYRTLRENAWLGQWDLPEGREVTVVISKVERYTPQQKRKKKMPDGTYMDEPNKRIHLSFKGKKKGWLAGPVSQEAIAGMYGPKVEDWIDKAITLYVDPTVKMGRVTTGGLRVRPTVPRGAPTDDPLEREPAPGQAEAIAAAAEEAAHG